MTIDDSPVILCNVLQRFSMTRLSTSIRIARGRKGWSQAMLAEKAGVSVTTVSWIEQGRTTDPQPDTIVRLADVLEVSPESLLADSAGAQADNDRASHGSVTTQPLPVAVNGSSDSAGATAGHPAD